MTIDQINEILDSMARGTLLGLCASFWIMGIAAIWKWFFGMLKRFLNFLCPEFCEKVSSVFRKKKGTDVDAENTHSEH